jgi:hypothetical protein
LATLDAYPAVAYTRSFADFGSAICEVATLFDTVVAAARLGNTSEWMCGQRPA